MADGSTITHSNHRTVARDSVGRIFQERRALRPDGDKKETALTQLQYIDPASQQFYNCQPSNQVCLLSNYMGLTRMASAANAGVNDKSEMNGAQVEDLGHKTIEGLDTIGTRETTIIPKGKIGNDQPIALVKEIWYSPKLGINLAVDRSDPRSGDEQFRVTNISLAEPDSTLFNLPSGFKIVDTRKPAQQ